MLLHLYPQFAALSREPLHQLRLQPARELKEQDQREALAALAEALHQLRLVPLCTITKSAPQGLLHLQVAVVANAL